MFWIFPFEYSTGASVKSKISKVHKSRQYEQLVPLICYNIEVTIIKLSFKEDLEYISWNNYKLSYLKQADMVSDSPQTKRLFTKKR